MCRLKTCLQLLPSNVLKLCISSLRFSNEPGKKNLKDEIECSYFNFHE